MSAPQDIILDCTVCRTYNVHVWPVIRAYSSRKF